MPTASWTVGLIAIAAVLVVLGLLLWHARRSHRQKPLPTEWAVTPRPVFSADERRVYRLLREALPHHIVLAKLPLVRFCQPSEPANVRYWYDLHGSNHVAFAVCSANGRVLAAIDLDTDRSSSRRALQIKQSVLNACRVRYLRCPVEQLPTVAELQLLVPQQNGPARGPQPAPAPTHRLHEARETLSTVVAHRRAERTALWQDSTLFQDSFFAPDSRLEGAGNSEFGPFSGVPAARRPTVDADEIGGVVVDAPNQPSPSSR